LSFAYTKGSSCTGWSRPRTVCLHIVCRPHRYPCVAWTLISTTRATSSSPQRLELRRFTKARRPRRVIDVLAPLGRCRCFQDSLGPLAFGVVATIAREALHGSGQAKSPTSLGDSTSLPDPSRFGAERGTNAQWRREFDLIFRVACDLASLRSSSLESV
jgi:hypothetical protein